MKIVSIIKDCFQETAPFKWGLALFCYNCNFSCEMCKGYNFEFVTDKNNIIGNSISIIKNNITPVHDCVVFIGGEPLIYKEEFIKSLEYCKSLNLKTKIFSNGYNYKILEKINELKLCDAWSIDLKGLENISSIVGIDILDENYLYSFNSCINNILKNKLYLEVRTTVTQVNKNQLSNIKNYCNKLKLKHIIQKDYRKK